MIILLMLFNSAFAQEAVTIPAGDADLQHVRLGSDYSSTDSGNGPPANYGWFNGEIAEAAYFQGTLDQTDRQALFDHCESYWGLSFP